MLSDIIKTRIETLQAEYETLVSHSPEANHEISLAEIPEMVFNSNAIENSTLTLADTESILLRDQIRKDASVREVYEAKNLASVIETLSDSPSVLTIELILSLHRLLLSGIDNRIAGRFRSGREWVRVGSHIGASPDLTNHLMYDLVRNYHADTESYFLDKIAYFHAELETIHPFCDGNGRIGRVLINQQLSTLNLPPIIIREKTKHSDYYPLFDHYRLRGSYSGFTELFALLLMESLHKRIAILSGKKLISLIDWAHHNHASPTAINNKARRQTIPAFRQSNKWFIAADFQDTPGPDIL